MNNPFWKPRATSYNNGDFISVETNSGYSLILADPEAEEYLLASDASDEDLGKAVLNALRQSRFIPLEEARKLNLNMDSYYKLWVQKLMDLYGYKTKNALFKNMMSCGIKLQDGVITICPSKHEKLEVWSGTGITEDKYLKVSANRPPEEIGAALRVAFKQCLGAKPREYNF